MTTTTSLRSGTLHDFIAERCKSRFNQSQVQALGQELYGLHIQVVAAAPNGLSIEAWLTFPTIDEPSPSLMQLFLWSARMLDWQARLGAADRLRLETAEVTWE